VYNLQLYSLPCKTAVLGNVAQGTFQGSPSVGEWKATVFLILSNFTLQVMLRRANTNNLACPLRVLELQLQIYIDVEICLQLQLCLFLGPDFM
jgi:hypothetical protein